METYRRLNHDLWLQLFSLHTRIVDLQSELSSLDVLDEGQCACSQAQERIAHHYRLLDLLQMVVLDPGDRKTGGGGDACLAWQRDLEARNRTCLEVQA